MSLLLFLLFLAPTIQYRIELGGFSFAIMEPIVLIVSVILLTHQVMTRRRLMISKDSFVFLVAGLALWASIVRPWSADWKQGVSDVRDWLIPVLGFVALISTIRRGWRKWVLVVLTIVVLEALLGIYQGLTNGLRPFASELAAYKTGFIASPDDNSLVRASYAVGLFSHPNGFAAFLFLGLMIALGWLVESRRRWLKALVVAVCASALFLTYAKASLLVMVCAIISFGLQRTIRSSKNLLIVISMTVVLGGACLWAALPHVPPMVFDTLTWRMGLWQTALDTLGNHPSILLVGNGLDIFAAQAYYPQPHNLYLYSILQYGILGLILCLVVLWQIWKQGWQVQKHQVLAREPLLAALWIALLGYFAIGLVESELYGIESRMIFLVGLACFIGLNRELQREASLQAADKEGYQHASAPVAHPRAV